VPDAPTAFFIEDFNNIEPGSDVRNLELRQPALSRQNQPVLFFPIYRRSGAAVSFRFSGFDFDKNNNGTPAVPTD
jgi:hypothetical protein